MGEERKIPVGDDGLYSDLEPAVIIMNDLSERLDEFLDKGCDMGDELAALYDIRKGADISNLDAIDDTIKKLEKAIDILRKQVEDVFDEIEVEHFLAYGAQGFNPNEQ